jgi:hypothetical protein
MRMDTMRLIQEKRENAAKTRRLAASLTWSDDRERLMRFAQEMENEAAALEREVSAFDPAPINTPRQRGSEKRA